MTSHPGDNMYINMRFINKTGYRLDLLEAHHTALQGAFPPELSDNNLEVRVDKLQFVTTPKLRGDILIDYDVKKSIFESRASYTFDNKIITFESSFLYAYEKRLNHRAPKVTFYWTHHCACAEYPDFPCRSQITHHNPSRPYSYTVDFFIG
ncbi:hypothetical protein [Pseudomonas lundensis]|uniref:hypothetical protein n=1 Tax=Pseudomonas lundensis TaxID=86185 RepID=UPI00089DBE77|nr:hypothetical protein [Pseudomonas lundensis]